jgi:hypothetical protein
MTTSLDRAELRGDILPKLQVRLIADATGASISRGSKMRGGLLITT